MAIAKKDSFDTWIGTAAEMAAYTSMQAGDRFITTDTHLEYEYTGAAWILKAIAVALAAGTALAGKFIPVDTDGDEKFTAGNPAVMQLSGSLIANEKSKVTAVATDIITDYTAPKTMNTTLMVSTNTSGILSLECDGILSTLNSGVALDTGKWYSFDIPMVEDLVYQLQFSAIATMQIKWIGGF